MLQGWGPGLSFVVWDLSYWDELNVVSVALPVPLFQHRITFLRTLVPSCRIGA